MARIVSPMHTNIPTGPAVVGLEPTVLPSAIVPRPAEPLGLEVTLATSKYGEALYALYLVAAGPDGTPQRHPYNYAADGGLTVNLSTEGFASPLRIEADLIELDLDEGALGGLSRAELLAALAHPVRSVRDAATLALAR